jgi:parvulin-like peptidyl-prolyl isomerase
LKAQIVDPKLRDYFLDRQIFLDRVVISRIVVENRELAEELRSQILEDNVPFEYLAYEESLAEDRLMNGMMGALSRGKIPDNLRAEIDAANPGELVGPIEADGLWCLLRVERFIPARFNEDEELIEELKEEIFSQWLEEKVQELEVQLQVRPSDNT